SRQSGLGTLYAWALNAQALVQAHVGQVDATRATAGEGLRVAQEAGAVAQVAQLTATLGFLELSLGDPAAAHERLGPLSELSVAVQEALAQHARLREPFELGRTLLAQGSIERRALRRAAARTALTRALEVFDELGAALWSDLAAAELARIPGRPPASGELSET